MTELNKRVKQIDLAQTDESRFEGRYVGCLVLSQDRKILLQQRGFDWDRFPNYLSEFGGRIDLAESPMHALLRELNEELGAKVCESDVISLGTITEETTKHHELIYVYFWHDKLGTITGCYEGEAKYFDNVKNALSHPKMMDSVFWLLKECQKRKFIK